IEAPGIAVARRAGSDGTDVRSRVRFRQREGTDNGSAGYPWQDRPLLIVAAEQRDRGAGETLHGKCEIGEARGPSQNLPCEAQAAHVDFFTHAAIRGGNASAQQSGGPEFANQPLDAVVDRVDVTICPNE